jgi:tetratricopeptide (TPR) repeat protein/ribonuclease BN (tRNA processing enzyme)
MANNNNLEELIKEADKIFRNIIDRPNSKEIYESALQKAIKENKCKYVHYINGKINLIEKEIEKAIDNFNSALNIDSEYVDALNYKAVALIYSEKYEDAIKYCDKVIDINSTYLLAYQNKGVALYYLERYEESIDNYNEIIKATTNEFKDLIRNAWYNKGISLYCLEKYEESLDCFNKALSIDPNSPKAWNFKGLVYKKLGKYEEAIECFNESINLDPNYFHSWTNMGVTYHKLGNYEKSLECYNNSLRIKENKIALNNRILALLNLKKLYQADIEQLYLKRIEEIDKKHISSSKKKQIKLELKAQKRVICKLRNDYKQILDEKDIYEEKLNNTLEPRENPSKENFIMVLRRWNSFTPAMITDTESNRGGGYILYWNGKGIVIDPGFDFLYNLFQNKLKIYDIDAVIITHSHIDHCNDFESILTLIHEYNESLEGKKKIYDSRNPKKENIKSKKEIERYNQDLINQKKKIDIFLNLGAMKKFLSWIPIDDEKIRRIYPLEKNVIYDLDDYKMKIKVMKSIHNEVLTKSYSVGLVFELYGSKGYNKRKPFRIGFTSDTRCDESVLKQYKNLDVIIPHLGSVEENDFQIFSDKKHKNHLMLKGVISALSKTNAKLAIISEFGEELGEHRLKIVSALNEVFQAEKGLKCITGDIGLKVSIPDLRVNCHYCHINEECLDSGSGIKVQKLIEDVDPTKKYKNVIYFCEKCNIIHKAKKAETKKRSS